MKKIHFVQFGLCHIVDSDLKYAYNYARNLAPLREENFVQSLKSQVDGDNIEEIIQRQKKRWNVWRRPTKCGDVFFACRKSIGTGEKGLCRRQGEDLPAQLNLMSAQQQRNMEEYLEQQQLYKQHKSDTSIPSTVAS
uniref:Uncharacterized protein n=1 Tax=Globodera pallida TaxID=36090 RepID=A0A183CGF7_GLOPA